MFRPWMIDGVIAVNNPGRELKRFRQFWLISITFVRLSKNSDIVCPNPEENMFTLAIDAFSVRTFSSATIATSTLGDKKEAIQMSNGFMFLLIPVCYRYPVRLVHLEPHPTGNYDKVIADLASEIKSIALDKCIRIYFKATDGDRYLTAEHQDCFAAYVCCHERKLCFCEITDSVYHELLRAPHVSLPIADPLHFAKNARSKLVHHAVVVQSDSETINQIDRKTLNRFLKLGKHLEDKSPLGAMRDKYATDLFTLTNVAKLIKEWCYVGAFTLFPFSCLFAVIFEPDLCNETRVLLVETAYQCCWHFLTELGPILKAHPTVKAHFGDGVEAVTIAEEGYLIRVIHTCIAFGIALRHGPRHVRLDALGTHLVENRIGNARGTCNDPRWTRILSTCSLGELRKELAEEIGVNLHWSKRVNAGGAKIDTWFDVATPIPHPEGWDALEIVSLFSNSLRSELSGAFSEELQGFGKKLTEFAARIRKPSIGDTSAVANASIMSRNISFGANLWKSSLDIADEPLLWHENFGGLSAKSSGGMSSQLQ